MTLSVMSEKQPTVNNRFFWHLEPHLPKCHKYRVVTAHDVAAYIRQERRPHGRMQLLKLVYYAQAWSLVWDRTPLFDDPIEAWPDGPVARSVWIDEEYNGGRGGDPEALNAEQRATIDEVIRFYGRFTGDQLSALTHHETPWIQARGDLPPSAKTRNVISPDSVRSYYDQFKAAPKKLSAALARGYALLLSLPPDERTTLFEESDEDPDAFLANLIKV